MVDPADDLELIPRAVRDKLDRVGIKLHLREWQLLVREERAWLRDMPCAEPDEIDGYRRWLDEIMVSRAGRVPDRLGGKQAG